MTASESHTPSISAIHRQSEVAKCQYASVMVHAQLSFWSKGRLLKYMYIVHDWSILLLHTHCKDRASDTCLLRTPLATYKLSSSQFSLRCTVICSATYFYLKLMLRPIFILFICLFQNIIGNVLLTACWITCSMYIYTYSVS